MSSQDARSSDFAPSRGLERWDDWLKERLSPASVTLSVDGVLTPSEYRWEVEFPSGVTSHIRIPRMVVEGGNETFERTTSRLESYGWTEALEMAGPRGYRVCTWGER